jgi:hypothetical protein
MHRDNKEKGLLIGGYTFASKEGTLDAAMKCAEVDCTRER